MRLFRVVPAFAILLAAIPAKGEQPAGSPPAKGGISKEAADSLRETWARSHFAPMWMPVPKYAVQSNAKPSLSPPVAAYAVIWQPQWQEALGLSAEQKKSLVAIHERATAEAKKQSEELQRLSPEERQARVKARAGKPSPERRALEKAVRRQIEAVLTPQQLQTIKDDAFPAQTVSLLYDAKVRQEIGFTPEQAARFRGIAKKRLARFQELSLTHAEKLWEMLTPSQQSEFREIVKHQGPTSAALSIAWELGFDFDRFVPSYPMLAESPVRKRLGLSAEQEKQLGAVDAEVTARVRVHEQRMLGEAPPESDVDRASWEDKAKKRVEAILSPEQLTTLKEIDLRRQVTLAFGYPEKRKSAGVSEEQFAKYSLLTIGSHKPTYEMDREMMARAVEILTPPQKDKLRAIVAERFGG